MNHRRNCNIVPVAALVRWVIIAAIICMAGLSYVYIKNQMQSTGSEIHALECQLDDLRTQDDVVRGQISKLSSYAYLRRKLAEGVIHMTPITSDRIVRIGPSRTASLNNDSGEGLRRVSNQTASP